MSAIRKALAWLLIALETVITWPVFVLSWFGSAVWLSLKAGRAIAELDSDEKKRASLLAMMGERSTK